MPWSASRGRVNDEYAAEHPDFLINIDTATVWFDDIVIAKKYVGPIKN